MAAYDPESLTIVQSIYHEVIQKFDDSDHFPSEDLRDTIAQDILRLVSAGRSNRGEIIASVLANVVHREGQSESPLSDEPRGKPISG